MPMKTCPFCGGNPYMEKKEDRYFVCCETCAATGGWSKTAEGAQMNWEARYPYK
jgi:hypothetical protein